MAIINGCYHRAFRSGWFRGFPVEDKDKKLVAEITAGLLGQVSSNLWKWDILAEYMGALERKG